MKHHGRNHRHNHKKTDHVPVDDIDGVVEEGLGTPVANADAVTEAGDRIRGWVRDQPLVALAAVGAAGAAIGSIAFPRVGRFMFLAAAGYVLNEVWHGDRKLAFDRFVGPRDERGSAQASTASPAASTD